MNQHIDWNGYKFKATSRPTAKQCSSSRLCWWVDHSHAGPMNESWVFFSCLRLSLRASVGPAVESVPVFPKRPVGGERVSSTLTPPSSLLAWINSGCVQMLCLCTRVYSSSTVNGGMCACVCVCACLCVYVACVGWANTGIKMCCLKLRDAAVQRRQDPLTVFDNCKSSRNRPGSALQLQGNGLYEEN